MVVALAINFVLFIVFISLKTTRDVPRPPATIALDISDYSLPELEQPEKSPEQVMKEATKEALSGQEKAPDAQSVIDTHLDKLKSDAGEASSLLQKTATGREGELARIADGIRTFEGINKVQAGLTAGNLPAGHSIGASFSQRSQPKQRQRNMKQYGGSAQTESAVERALRFLAGVQNRDGSWGSRESFASGDSVALSSLALLAFLSHGENFHSTPHAKCVRKGIDYLQTLAEAPGIEMAGGGFGHAILTYALAEGYAVNGSMSLRQLLEKRLDFIIKNQNSFGSFALNYDNSPTVPPSKKQLENPLYKEIMVGEPACDLSLLGWHIQAMTAAKNAGVNIEGLDRALALATEAVVKIHQAERGGFSQGTNMRRFPANHNMTPVGLLALQLLDSGGSVPARRAERIIKELPVPRWNSSEPFPLYRWYYQTQAIFQAEKGRGKLWEAWNTNLKKELPKAQQPNGSWKPPVADNDFRVKNQEDQAIYSTSICSLILQVYYRYLPSYSIAESSDGKSKADELDLGAVGLITRLPGGVDPMASVILGFGTKEMEPVIFGRFDGQPATSKDPAISGEFPVFGSMRATIPVRKVEDWPQTLQANQRLAVFLDELIPRNYKGHLSLQLAVVGTVADAFHEKMSLEAVINGKRIYNSFLHREKQLVTLLIPCDTLQGFGNILQLRNNGGGTLAFDAACLASVNKIGHELFLLGEKDDIPEKLHQYFSSKIPPESVLCQLEKYQDHRQLLPVIDYYDPEKLYLADYPVYGNEYLGNDFSRYDLTLSGREIVDWIAGGGAGVRLKNMMNGGRFFDTVFHSEYPAFSALSQVAKVFAGKPHRLLAQFYPKYGSLPMSQGNVIAAYNAPGIATLAVTKRSVVNEESEVIAVLPWSGETVMEIEKGFLEDGSPHLGFTSKIEKRSETITVENQVFRFSGVFPEMTIIRLYRKGTQPLPAAQNARYRKPPELKIDSTTLQRSLPRSARDLEKVFLWTAARPIFTYGQTAVRSTPATAGTERQQETLEKSSGIVTFSLPHSPEKRHDSAYFLLPDIQQKKPRYLSIDVWARASYIEKGKELAGIPVYFAFGGKCYAMTIPLNSWRKIVLPLAADAKLPSFLRLIKPENFRKDNVMTISYEVNNITVYCE